MSQDLRVRPSVVLGASDPLTAFAVDRAVWSFARVIQSEQEAATKRLPQNAKTSAHERANQRVLDKFLGVGLVEEPGRFRSPGKR
jgi:hypothetical protein